MHGEVLEGLLKLPILSHNLNLSSISFFQQYNAKSDPVFLSFTISKFMQYRPLHASKQTALLSSTNNNVMLIPLMKSLYNLQLLAVWSIPQELILLDLTDQLHKMNFDTSN